MSLTQFRMFMQEQFRVSYTMLPIVNRVFDVLDVDGGGTLSWQVRACVSTRRAQADADVRV